LIDEKKLKEAERRVKQFIREGIVSVINNRKFSRFNHQNLGTGITISESRFYEIGSSPILGKSPQ